MCFILVYMQKPRLVCKGRAQRAQEVADLPQAASSISPSVTILTTQWPPGYRLCTFNWRWWFRVWKFLTLENSCHGQNVYQLFVELLSEILQSVRWGRHWTHVQSDGLKVCSLKDKVCCILYFSYSQQIGCLVLPEHTKTTLHHCLAPYPSLLLSLNTGLVSKIVVPISHLDTDMWENRVQVEKYQSSP